MNTGGSVLRKLKKSEKTAAFAGIGLFADLSKKELGFICQQVTQMTFHEGNVLATEGDLGREAMVIVEGSADVRRAGRKVASLRAGDVLGEMSLINHVPRNATVTATSETTVLLMDAREFASVLATNPNISEKMLRTVAARLVENEKGVV